MQETRNLVKQRTARVHFLKLCFGVDPSDLGQDRLGAAQNFQLKALDIKFQKIDRCQPVLENVAGKFLDRDHLAVRRRQIKPVDAVRHRLAKLQKGSALIEAAHDQFAFTCAVVEGHTVAVDVAQIPQSAGQACERVRDWFKTMHLRQRLKGERALSAN